MPETKKEERGEEEQKRNIKEMYKKETLKEKPIWKEGRKEQAHMKQEQDAITKEHLRTTKSYWKLKYVPKFSKNQ